MDLTRMQLAFAKQVAPHIKTRGSVYVNRMLQSVLALRGAGWRRQAANLSAEILGDYRTIYGNDDEDASSLEEWARDATDTFGKEFFWERWEDEIGDLCFSAKDQAGVESTFQALRHALRDRPQKSNQSAAMSFV